MQAFRDIVRLALRVLRFTGQFLLSVLRLYRLAKRIKLNTASWEQLPGQSTPVGGAASL